MEIAIVLGLIAAVSVLFATEWIPVDLVTLLVILVLIVSGILTTQEAFSGFGSDILIMLASVFVLSGAMKETGIVDWMGFWLSKFTKGQKTSTLTASVMTSVSSLSAVMNNTTVTALMLGPVAGLAKERKISPSCLLMPLSFASILGGTCTVIGTSTNVAVSGYLKSRGEEGIGFFELTPLGLILVAIGTAAMVFLGRRMLPAHAPVEDVTESYGLQEYLSEIVVLPGSSWIGASLRSCDFDGLDLRILTIVRKGVFMQPTPSTKLEAGDILLVKADASNLIKVRETGGIEIRPDMKFSVKDLAGGDLEILEVLITPLSSLKGRLLKDLDLPSRGITVLAINRHGRQLRTKLKDVRLGMGDLLLVQASKEDMDAFRKSPDVAVYGEQNAGLHKGRKGFMVLGAMLLAVLLSALDWVPLPAALLAAALTSVFLRTIPFHRIYQVIEWRLLVLIAGMMALGLAMQKTGAAAYLADGITSVLEPGGPWLVLVAFVLLTVLLTQPMSNAAAALVILPVAFSSAAQLGANPRTFGIAIAFAASVSLLAPFEPSSLLVMGPGRYRIMDFLKIGGFITLLLLVAIVFLVPQFWPLMN